MGTCTPSVTGPLARILSLAGCLALAACNGTALVTLTATPASVTGFLAYRVKLVAVEIQDSSGAGSQSVLPAALSVDLAQVTSVGEILSASTVKKGNYTRVTVRLDYSHAQIVADDGSLAGMMLTPQDAGGKALGELALTLQFDPANPLRITTGSTSQFELDVRLAATNSVNLSTRTVTVTPVLLASALPIDAKTLRLRGPLTAANSSNSNYTAAIEPFDGLVLGAGSYTRKLQPSCSLDCLSYTRLRPGRLAAQQWGARGS